MARNAISSIINKKQVDKELAKNVSFVAYNIYDSTLTLEEQYIKLKEKKFIIPDNIIPIKKILILMNYQNVYLIERKIQNTK